MQQRESEDSRHNNDSARVVNIARLATISFFLSSTLLVKHTHHTCQGTLGARSVRSASSIYQGEKLNIYFTVTVSCLWEQSLSIHTHHLKKNSILPLLFIKSSLGSRDGKQTNAILHLTTTEVHSPLMRRSLKMQFNF